MSRSLRVCALVAALACLPFAPTHAQSPSAPTAATAAPQPQNDYSKPESWLCRPGRKDACAVDLTTTVVPADGKLRREGFTPNPQAPIDCFYVYPTVSMDETPNSDMSAGPEEYNVILQQFARFASQCRVYAPLYRQVTLTEMVWIIVGNPLSF
jgi:hypothetical protein